MSKSAPKAKKTSRRRGKKTAGAVDTAANVEAPKDNAPKEAAEEK